MKHHPHLGEPAIRTSLMDDLFGLRCDLCGERSKDVEYVSWTTEILKDIECHKYHMVCVRNILNNPEIYPQSRVGFSIDIVKRLRLRKTRQHAHDLFVLNSKVKTLKEKRMLRKQVNEAIHTLNTL